MKVGEQGCDALSRSFGMSGFLFPCRVLQTRFGWDVLSDMGVLPRPPEAVRLKHTGIINEDIADETGTSRYDEAQMTSE